MFKWVADSGVSADFQQISPRFGICFTDNKVSFENYNFCKKCLEFAEDLWKVNDKIYEGIPAGEHAGLNRCQIACACHRTPLIIRSFSHVSEALANAPHFMSTFVDKMFPHKKCINCLAYVSKFGFEIFKWKRNLSEWRMPYVLQNQTLASKIRLKFAQKRISLIKAWHAMRVRSFS